MKIAVSNIAWSPANRLEAYEILKKYNVTGLEIAPGIFFHQADDAFLPSEKIADLACKEISRLGIQLVSMQSLLYGVEGAAIFEGENAFIKFKQGMERAISLAARFQIPNLVFGSPKQRIIPESMKYKFAENFAAKVFRELGEHALKAGTVIALESNPSAYGTNFLNDIKQTQKFAELVNHPSITVNLDIGAMYMNDQFGELEASIKKSPHLISHVHISEPNLEPAPASIDKTADVLKILKKIEYKKWISIEMKPDPSNELESLDKCLKKLSNAFELSE